MKKRLLFLDILKIAGVGFILLWHMYFATNKLTWFLPVYGQIHLGNIGVFIFLIASGAALAYNYYDFNEIRDVGIFYYNRFIRIYPALWISIFFTIMVIPALIPKITFIKLCEELTGFYCYFNNEFPFINGVLWFIGLILVLYLLYPVLLSIIKKYGVYGFLGLFSFSMAGHVYLNYNNIFMNYSNPLVYLTFGPFGVIPYIWPFVLGMYIVLSNYYPKVESKNFLVMQISNVSFYIYIIQGAIFPIFYVNIPLFFTELVFASYLIMLADTRIQKWLQLPLVLDKLNSILTRVTQKGGLLRIK